MSFIKSTERAESISLIIARRYRSVLILIGVLLGVLWIALTSFFLTSFFRQMSFNVYSWVNINRPQVEEALYLHNLEAIELRLRQSLEKTENNWKYTITVFDTQKRRIYGTVTSFPENVHENSRNHPFQLELETLQTLNFANAPQGYLYVTAELAPALVS